MRRSVAAAITTAVFAVLAGRSQSVSAQTMSHQAEALEWRQLMGSYRIGGRLTALAVDWNDPNHVIVGTQEQTIGVSHDGGETWQEFPLSPSVVQSRSINGPQLVIAGRHAASVFVPNQIVASMFGVDAFGGVGFNVLSLSDATRPAPWQSFSVVGTGGSTPRVDSSIGGADLALDRIQLEDFSNQWSGLSESSLGVQQFLPPIRSDILDSVLQSRLGETEAVVRVIFCAGARYPVLVATTKTLWGTTDELNFVRLYYGNAPGGVQGALEPFITDVDCSPVNPNEVVLSTANGFVRSLDGGQTFPSFMRGAGVGDATAASFDVVATDGQVPILAANAPMLYVGSPDSSEGMQYVYPGDFNDPNNAPYEAIRWITTTPSGQIWLATDSGVRASLDGGGTWQQMGVGLFGRDPIIQVEWNTNGEDHERVLVVTEQRVWATEDSGRTFFPFFTGLTRRGIKMVAPGPPGRDGRGRWWVLTTGELWSTEEPDVAAGDADDAETRHWALTRIEGTPPLGVCFDDAFERLGLDADSVDGLVRASHSRALAPIVNARFFAGTSSTAFAGERMITEPITLEAQRVLSGWGFFAVASWSLPDFVYTSQVRVRDTLYQLRQQVGFVIEDAWNERQMHLNRLAQGRVDMVTAEILRTRIETLETVLEAWTGVPLDSQDTRTR